MKLSYNWLKEILPDLKLKPEKLAELLNMHVAEVEKVKKLGQGMGRVIVAEIIGIKSHPNADKLQIAVVDTGRKKLEIVCGAPNIKVGQKVPLALAGAELAGGMEIKESIIRGVKSEGMLCSEDELDIGPDHEGIHILSDRAKIGQPIAEVLGLDDTILEVENKSITHRPDLFNHLGFAREISACLGKLKIKGPELKTRDTNKSINKKVEEVKIDVKVENKNLCPRYTAVVMGGVKVGPSPEWLQTRLRNLGIRPISNAVDITNYVLMEIGQPLHVFDAEKLTKEGDKLIIKIRSAQKGEKLLALDGQEYELVQTDLVIADAKKPIALAGVMGGELSGVTETTRTIVIESANFEPVSVRRTSWRLGLRSDSALRFEKGLPVCCPQIGMKRAVELVKELAGGQMISQIYDIKSRGTVKKLKQSIKINFDFARARKFIGLDIADKEMVQILQSLGCRIKKQGKKMVVTVPAFRPDISLSEDLVEEIVRIYGTEKIVPEPILGKLEPVPLSAELVLEEKIKNILVGSGFDEVYNYSFYSNRTIADNHLVRSKHLEIDNPLNPDQQYLRISLIPGLVKNANKNVKNFPEFKIFEVGRVFNPEENKKIAGLIYPGDYWSIKGVVELIFERIGIKQNEINYQTKSSGATAISIGQKVIGSCSHQNQFGIFELDFAGLLKFTQRAKKYVLIPTYPPIKRDLGFLVDKKVRWQEIAEIAKSIDPLVKDIELFDVFEDKKLGDKRNLAFHIVYQSLGRTLKTEEIEKIEKQIIKILGEKFNAQLRDF